MKILVTGGAGFIASHIVDKYIELGHTVHIIDNLSTGKRENLNPEASFYELDINSEETRDLILKEKYDIISHHAAQMNVRLSVSNPLYDAKSNILGTLNIMEAAKDSGVKKVIFASSGGTVYGEQEKLPSVEEDEARPCSPYGIGKLSVEKYLFYYQEVYGIKFIAHRYGNVYGRRQNPEGEAGVVAIFIDKMLKGEQPIINGDGLITRDYIYIDDVIEANVIALREEVEGIYNVTTGREITVNNIFKSIKDILKVNTEEKHGPAKAGEQRRSVCSYEKYQKMHGFQPKFTFEQGLALTIEDFKKMQ